MQPLKLFMELWFLLTFFPGSSSENAPRGRSYGSPQHVLPRCSFNCNLVCLVSELPNHGRQRGRRGGDPADLWTALKFLQSFSHAAGLWECQGDLGFRRGQAGATDHYPLQHQASAWTAGPRESPRARDLSESAFQVHSSHSAP